MYIKIYSLITGNSTKTRNGHVNVDNYFNQYIYWTNVYDNSIKLSVRFAK